MKIVTWNCNGAFRKKFDLIESFKADIIVVQECEDPNRSTDTTYKEWAKNYIWVGQDKNKGLAIFCKDNVRLEKLDWDSNGLQLLLPCRIDKRFSILAVWTKHANSPNFGYIGQLWKYLQIHKSKLTLGDFVICGDFNSNAIWDEWDRWWNHSDVVRELGEMNILSMYHEQYKEGQGQESKPTLFMYRDLKKPYHIDYAFASKTLLDKKNGTLVVGDPKVWLSYSDHVPIIFDI